MLSILFFTYAIVQVHALVLRTPASAWSVENFNSFLPFGDSYTDENRINYFAYHNGSAPPPGTFLPESFDTPGGGRTWPRYVIQYTGQTVNGQWNPQMTLYNYAVSGAVCSNLITPRFNPTINENWPSVLEYEVPAFLADQGTVRNGTSTPYFTPPLSATDAVYSIWIGTNDLGVDLFLTDGQIRGKNLTDYMNCIYQSLDPLYENGGRYFVLMDLAPLDLAPLYANASEGGVVAGDHYWPTKPNNITAISEKMREYTSTLNTVYQYQTPFEVIIAQRYPGANFAIFDVHQLMTDIYTDPSAYLNGSAPLNVTGFDKQCNSNGSICTLSASPDSFLWFDELHPSEQTDRIIARNFIDILNGNSSYGTYYSG